MLSFTSHRILACTTALILAAAAPAGDYPCSCLGDHNYDFIVNGADLGILLGDWSTNAPRSDFNQDGTVDGADLGIMLGAWGACPSAPNDYCANAILVTDGQYEFCNKGTGTDGPLHASGCGAPATIANDIWYQYVAPEDGELTATLCYAVNFDSAISIYTTPSGVAACPGSGGAYLLGCNSNNESCPFSQAEVTVPVLAGHTYTIRVGSESGQEGWGTLTVAMGYNGSGPDNAIWLGSGGLYVTSGYTGDNSSSVQFPNNCFSGTTPGPSEWISWYCSCSGTMTATTCSPNTNFDTVLTVLDHSPSSPGTWWETMVACNDDSPIAGCQLNGVNRKSHVTFQTIAGHYYYFVVSGYNGAQGDYRLTIQNTCP